MELNQQHEKQLLATKDSMLAEFKKKSEQIGDSFAAVDVKHKQELVDVELKLEQK